MAFPFPERAVEPRDHDNFGPDELFLPIISTWEAVEEESIQRRSRRSLGAGEEVYGEEDTMRDGRRITRGRGGARVGIGRRGSRVGRVYIRGGGRCGISGIGGAEGRGPAALTPLGAALL